MKPSSVVVAVLAVWLSCLPLATASAEEGEAAADDAQPRGARRIHPVGVIDSPEDPANEVPLIRARGAERDSLLPVSPLHGLHDLTTRGKDFLAEKLHLELALGFNHVIQGLSESLADTDQWGTASDMDLYAQWKLINRGEPTQGQIFFQAEGRWDYGTTGPTDLGPNSLGSLAFTANAFAQYQPKTFLVRNLYWQQGGREAGWFYRIGKITPDQTLGTSAHLSPITTFLTIAGTGGFANALPDSGLGASGGWTNGRLGFVGVFSDANADRQDWGDIGAGDFYKGLDFVFKPAPRTEKAGYSKISLWHTDGTSDGQAINGMAGPSGWGFFIKLEQELTADGRAVGLLRYGRGFNDSALYRQLGGVNLLLYDPDFIGRIRNDLVGVAFTWVEPTAAGSRDEYALEAFYRFPLFPLVDMSLIYHLLINPALDLDNSTASSLSLRLRTTF